MTGKELMNQFFDTVSYDTVVDWRDYPELGEEEDETGRSSTKNDITHTSSPKTTEAAAADGRTLGGPGSGDFGHVGRPGVGVGGSGYGLPNSTGILATINNPDGGFTYSPVTGESPTSGFAIAHAGNEKIIDADDPDAVALEVAQYAKDHWDFLKQSGNYMGGWHNPNDNKIYLDVSTGAMNRKEAERIARHNHQIAYFDLLKGESVTVEGGSHVIKANVAFDGTEGRPASTTGSYSSFQSLNWKDAQPGNDRENEADHRGLIGTSASGNHGHAGRPGIVGGSAPNMVKKLREMLMVTDDPAKTKFLLPDGTRLTTTLSHDAVNLEATKDSGLDMKHRYNAAQDQGIVEFYGEFSGVAMRTPLTKEQAEVIANDWNKVYKHPVQVDYGPPWLDATGNTSIWDEEGVAKKFDVPFTAETLRLWSENASKKTRLLESNSETVLHEAADSFIERLKVTLRYAFAQGRVAVHAKQLQAAQNVSMAEAAMSGAPYAVRDALQELLPKVLMKVVVAGGEAGIELLPVRTAQQVAKSPLRTAFRRQDIKLDIKFDDTNEAAIEWVREHALELADDISETSRRNIKRALVDVFSSGEKKRDLYKTILQAVGDEDRADLIARSETMKAASEGQRMMWDQAVEDGYLTGRERKRWIVTPDERLCPLCHSLDGKTTRLDGSYPDPGGYGPPIHPRCRCSEGII